MINDNIPIVHTFLGTNISPPKGTFEDDFPFRQLGYVSSLEGIVVISMLTGDKGSEYLQFLGI